MKNNLQTHLLVCLGLSKTFVFGLYSKKHNSMVFFDPQEGCQDGIPPYVSSAKGFMLFYG